MTAFRQSGWSLNSIKKAERPLTEADWTRLKNLMEQADFWAMPETHHRMGLDGFNWTIEGRDRDRYHSSECWAPDDGAFYDLGNLLVEFSGLEMPHDSP